jgi:hypothetical protein
VSSDTDTNWKKKIVSKRLMSVIWTPRLMIRLNHFSAGLWGLDIMICGTGNSIDGDCRMDGSNGGGDSMKNPLSLLNKGLFKGSSSVCLHDRTIKESE